MNDHWECFYSECDECKAGYLANKNKEKATEETNVL